MRFIDPDPKPRASYRPACALATPGKGLLPRADEIGRRADIDEGTIEHIAVQKPFGGKDGKHIALERRREGNDALHHLALEHIDAAINEAGTSGGFFRETRNATIFKHHRAVTPGIFHAAQRKPRLP